MLRWDRDQKSLNFNDLSSFQRLLRITIISTYALIVLGSAVRATQSGLACPDWPLCFSKLIPHFDFQIFMEWIHRVDAAFVSILFLGITYKLFKSKQLRSVFILPIVAGCLLLSSQIILGGLTVLKLLEPTIVSMHLLNAVLFLGILTWMYVKADTMLKPHLEGGWRIPPRLRGMLYALPVLLLSQLVLGGAVSTTHSGLACADFPSCHGRYFSGFGFAEWLQMSHRYLAYVLVAIIFYITLYSTGLRLPPKTARAMRWLPLLIVVQIILGVINIFWFIPVSVTVLHLANAVLILLVSALSAFELMTIQIQYEGVSPARKFGTKLPEVENLTPIGVSPKKSSQGG